MVECIDLRCIALSNLKGYTLRQTYLSRHDSTTQTAAFVLFTRPVEGYAFVFPGPNKKQKQHLSKRAVSRRWDCEARIDVDFGIRQLAVDIDQRPRGIRVVTRVT